MLALIFMSDQIIKGYSTLSNHGTSQGIIPRFYLQMRDMAQFAIDKNDLENRFAKFMQKNIPDLTDFYDLFNEIKDIYTDYREGLQNGKYYSLNEKTAFHHDRSKEIILKRKIKDFFILGRLVVFNFGKSEIINDGNFILDNFFFVKDSNFEKNKLDYLENKSEIDYSILIEIIEKSRASFLTAFNQIRADFEHKNLQVDDFGVRFIDGKVEIVEPTFGHSNLLTEMEISYEKILDLIEILMAYYFGLNAVKKMNGFMSLFRRNEYDYSNLKYKYAIQPIIYETGLTRLLN